MEYLINKLNKLCNKLHNKFDINYGGCCYVAYIIAKHLDELNIPYKLCVYDYYDLNTDSVQHELDTKCINYDDEEESICGKNTSNHYCIIIEDKTINGCECYYNKYTFDADHKIIKWIYKEGDWNDSYNVVFNKNVRNSINYLFKKYGKERKEN